MLVELNKAQLAFLEKCSKATSVFQLVSKHSQYVVNGCWNGSFEEKDESFKDYGLLIKTHVSTGAVHGYETIDLPMIDMDHFEKHVNDLFSKKKVEMKYPIHIHDHYKNVIGFFFPFFKTTFAKVPVNLSYYLFKINDTIHVRLKVYCPLDFLESLNGIASACYPGQPQMNFQFIDCHLGGKCILQLQGHGHNQQIELEPDDNTLGTIPFNLNTFIGTYGDV